LPQGKGHGAPKGAVYSVATRPFQGRAGTFRRATCTQGEAVAQQKMRIGIAGKRMLFAAFCQCRAALSDFEVALKVARGR
jgi:hypothetical protein